MHSVWIYPLLFLTGTVAGLIDAIAGGGGLITLSVLLGVGFPPHIALGTNKFQACFGSFTASYYYMQKGGVSLKSAMPGIIFTLIGSALGTWTVQQVNSDILKDIIPFLLAAIIVYSLLSPKLGETDKHPRMGRYSFYIAFGLMLGFYDGFFGPGVGSFWAISFVIMLGFNLTKATGYTKVMNFTSNIVSFIIFIAGGFVMFAAGLAMAAGQILGSKIGAGLVIKRGTKFIRPIFITMVVLTTLKLIYSRFF
ncbi:MAG: TSUP family transporter [Ignavibacteria bacterium]|nr:TSUP family transporter [Ignavibacteria bacterium]MCU7520209.1 TSUP family transporter [Ignavibacteria bacterium]MCU7523670.1 TSUP family transporter [Ignavibacteria bacterium]